MNAADLKQMSNSNLEAYISQLRAHRATFETSGIAPLMTLENYYEAAIKEWDTRIGKALFGRVWAKVGA